MATAPSTGTTATESAPSPSSTLKLEPVTEADISKITALWYEAFRGPFTEIFFPDTPEIRQWWDDTNRKDLLNKPYQKYLKVVDTTENNRIIAYAKWDLSSAEQRGERFPPWGPSMDHERLDKLFTSLEEERKRVLGGQMNYYLDTLATHPDYHRRGAGFLLVKWGCDEADKASVPAYIDASQAGKGLYLKLGFEDFSDPAFTSPNISSMVRYPIKEAKHIAD